MTGQTIVLANKVDGDSQPAIHNVAGDTGRYDDGRDARPVLFEVESERFVRHVHIARRNCLHRPGYPGIAAGQGLRKTTTQPRTYRSRPFSIELRKRALIRV